MTDNNEVLVGFISGHARRYYGVVKVDTDIEYSMYQLTDAEGNQVFIEGKVIEYIEFGSKVEIEEF